jgi:Tol biopolymer transport system component
MRVRPILTLAAALGLSGCLQPYQPESLVVEYETREESTAVTNVSVISADNLYVWNAISPVDDKNLVYSAKQWGEGALPDIVSVWRSPSQGGPATKLVPAGERESLHTAVSDHRSGNVYFALDCSLCSTGRTGGGGRRKYASTGYCDYSPVPFPADSRLLFVSAPGADNFYRDSNYLWIMNADGTNMLQLRRGYQPRLAPDGKRIVFTYGGDVWTMNVDGTEATNLSASNDFFESAPGFSPDGKTLFFQRSKRLANGFWGNADIWMMRADGTELVQLTMNPADDTQPVATADGNVYFLSNRGPLVNGYNPRRVWRMQVVAAQ